MASLVKTSANKSFYDVKYVSDMTKYVSDQAWK
jgi:hypothetical protein